MRKLLAVAAAALASAALLAMPASAHHCGDTVFEVGPFYVADDAQGTWIYMESNGAAGLQRGGQAAYDSGTGYFTDSCAHANPDTVIF